MTQDTQNKPMLAVIAVLVILLLLGAFFFMKKSDKPATSGTTGDTTMEQEEGNDDTSMMENGKNTLMGIMGMGKSLECSFSYETAGKAASTGLMFISGQKVYGEFGSEVGGKQATTNMIQDGEYIYMWGSAMPEGIKMKAVTTVPTGGAGVTTPQNTQYFDPNQQMDFKCKPWNADNAKFTVPSDVTFRDMSAMMEDAKKGQCAACAQLQGEAKTTCEKQLGC